MKKKMIFAAICVASLLAGCGDPDPRGKMTPDNQPIVEKDYEVKFLFEIDGVKVYRFYDNRSVYFTVPSSETYYEEKHTRTHRVGKNTTTTTSTDRVECINAKPTEQ